MDQIYVDIAKVMRAASDPKRVLILDMLSCGERCALEIQDALSLAQPTISYHMKLLSDAGIVSVRYEGKYTFYSLNPPKIHDFMQRFTWITMPKSNCICHTTSAKSCQNSQEFIVSTGG